MYEIFFNWSLIVSITYRLDSIALSHKDMALAFIFLRTVVVGFTPFSHSEVSNALLKSPLSLYNLLANPSPSSDTGLVSFHYHAAYKPDYAVIGGSASTIRKQI